MKRRGPAASASSAQSMMPQADTVADIEHVSHCQKATLPSTLAFWVTPAATPGRALPYKAPTSDADAVSCRP
jgi:hypothetical protein